MFARLLATSILSGALMSQVFATTPPLNSKRCCRDCHSIYTEPANLPHFVEVRDAVVIQVSGVGPSGRAFVAAAKGK